MPRRPQSKTPKEPPEVFNRFLSLPAELRIKIWEEACGLTKSLFIFRMPWFWAHGENEFTLEGPGVVEPNRPTVIRNTCQESKAVVDRSLRFGTTPPANSDPRPLPTIATFGQAVQNWTQQISADTGAPTVFWLGDHKKQLELQQLPSRWQKHDIVWFTGWFNGVGYDHPEKAPRLADILARYPIMAEVETVVFTYVGELEWSDAFSTIVSTITSASSQNSRRGWKQKEAVSPSAPTVHFPNLRRFYLVDHRLKPRTRQGRYSLRMTGPTKSSAVFVADDSIFYPVTEDHKGWGVPAEKTGHLTVFKALKHIKDMDRAERLRNGVGEDNLVRISYEVLAGVPVPKDHPVLGAHAE